MNDIRRRETAGFARKALLLIGFWAVAAMFMAMFWVRDSDVAAARAQALREKAPSPDKTPPVLPKITRQDFEFKLPVPGEKGKYQWKISGRKSISVNATTDRISDFRGEVIDGDDVIKVSSPVAVFDKDKNNRVLYCEGGVTTRMDIARALVRELEPASPSPAGKIDPSKASPDGSKEKKKKRSHLVITARKFSLDLKKRKPLSESQKKLPPPPLAIYTGDVVAKDDSGTIYADKMEVWNYTDEEEKKNPKLKGIKIVRCTGNVIINQVEGKKQARCAIAVYDAKTNIIHLFYDPKTGKKVVYRDEEQKMQVKALELIFDRNENKIIFDKEVETIDFNPDRKSFLGFLEPESSKPEKPKPVSGSEEKTPVGGAK